MSQKLKPKVNKNCCKDDRKFFDYGENEKLSFLYWLNFKSVLNILLSVSLIPEKVDYLSSNSIAKFNE